MTTINLESKSLNQSEVRILATTNSLLAGGVYMGNGDSQPSREFPRPVEGASAFDFDPIRDQITHGEKPALMERQAAGELGGVKLRATGMSEWDHFVIAFDRDQSRELNELGPEALNHVRDVITAAMNRGLHNPDERRQVLGFDLHTGTPEIHFHCLISRFGIYDGKCSAMIKQDRTSESGTLFQNINEALHQAGYTFLTSREFREQLAGYEFTPEERITEPDAGRSIAGNARTLEPQEQKISSAISSKERRIEELKRQLEEEEAAKENLQHGLAGLVQIREANEAAEASHAAQLEAERQRDAALTETAETKITAAAEVEAAANAKAEAEAIAAEQTAKAEAAEKHGVVLASDLEQERESKAELADELAEVKDEVEPLRAQNADMAERLERIEAQQAQLAEQLATAQQDAAQKAAENDALNRQMQAEQRAFSESLSEMTDLRTENMSLTQQLRELKDNVAAQISSFKEQLGGSLRDLILWRRENVEGADKDDRKFISDAVKATQKNNNDNEKKGPKGP